MLSGIAYTERICKWHHVELLAAGFSSLLFVDPKVHDDEHFLGHPAQRSFSGALPQGWSCLPAAGNNQLRRMQIAAIKTAGWELATLIAPTATIGAGATIAAGCFVAHHAHVGPAASIGVGTIINTAGVIEHECSIGDYVHVSVNSTVAGRSRLGDSVFLGTGATVIDNITVGANITIGAGGVVVKSINEPGTYVGAPARMIKAFT